MRKINNQLPTPSSHGQNKRVTLRFNADLLQKVENIIQTQRFNLLNSPPTVLINNQQSYNNVSQFLRTVLINYQQGKIKPASQRNEYALKREINIRFPVDLFNFYCSLPTGQRIGIWERCIIAYLNQLATSEPSLSSAIPKTNKAIKKETEKHKGIK